MASEGVDDEEHSLTVLEGSSCVVLVVVLIALHGKNNCKLLFV